MMLVEFLFLCFVSLFMLRSWIGLLLLLLFWLVFLFLFYFVVVV